MDTKFYIIKQGPNTNPPRTIRAAINTESTTTEPSLRMAEVTGWMGAYIPITGSKYLPYVLL